MGYTVNIIPNGQFSQVDMTSSKGIKKSFGMPSEMTDSFCKNFEKKEKTYSIITNTSFVGSAILGTYLTSLLTRKIKNDALKFMVNCLGGVASIVTAIVLSSNYIMKNQNDFLKQHHAFQIRNN